MSRVRDDKELQDILTKFRVDAEHDLGIPFPADVVKECLSVLLRARVAECVKRRLGHLRDSDFTNLVRLYLAEQKKK